MKFTSLNTRILIGSALGIAAGFWMVGAGQTPLRQNTLYVAKLVGNLFLDLLRLVLVPLVFASLVVGVANLRQHNQIHRVWQVTLASFLYTVALTGRRHRGISENT